MTWHVSADVLDAWVAGRANGSEAAAVEAHLLRCAPCRGLVTIDVASGPDLSGVWRRVEEAVVAPPAGPLTALLRRGGAREPDLVVLRAAPAATLSWAVALAVVVALSFLAASLEPQRTLGFYLLLAPLVPATGVAAGYGRAVDPTFELVVAAPVSEIRVLLLRSLVVVCASIPVTCAVGLLLDPWWVAVAWLGPGLTAVLLVLVAITWTSPGRAVVGVAALWSGATAAAMLEGDQLAVIGGGALVACAVVSAIALAVFLARTHVLPLPGDLGGRR